MSDEPADTRRRVKLYMLNSERQWDDRGTGYLSYSYTNRLDGIALLLRAEVDGTLLLESKIQNNTPYQKQQETLIVWSEAENFDLALSFQEKEGCDEIWEKICHVQGKDPSLEVTHKIPCASDEKDSRDEEIDENYNSPSFELPNAEVANLCDIKEILSSCFKTLTKKEKVAMLLYTNHYIEDLLMMFDVLEDAGNLDGLYSLYEIITRIFLLNKHPLFDIMFSDKNILRVVGCLEYDPSDPCPGKHRHYLTQSTRFHEVIPIHDKALLAKIHQTHRIQYIQDVILSPVTSVEDNMYSTILSFIVFNKGDIVNSIQEDETFLTDLISFLGSGDTDKLKLRNGFLLLKELCTYSQYIQPQAKENYIKTLSDLGIFGVLERGLSSIDHASKVAVIDVLTFFCDLAPQLIREYAIQQSTSVAEEKLLMNLMIKEMIFDKDPELGTALQLSRILLHLVDPDNILILEKIGGVAGYFTFFYKHCIPYVLAPLIRYTIDERKLRTNDSRMVKLLGIVIEFLTLCFIYHPQHMRSYIIQKDLLRKVMRVTISKHSFLVLGGVRFFRRIIDWRDETCNRYIVKGELFTPVVNLFLRNKSRNNLVESAVLELFDFLKGESQKLLCIHVMEKYGSDLENIHYVQTFKQLKTRYLQYTKQENSSSRLSGDGDASSIDSSPVELDNVSIRWPVRNSAEYESPEEESPRFRKDPRQLDSREESWFDEDEHVALGVTEEKEKEMVLERECDKQITKVATDDGVVPSENQKGDNKQQDIGNEAISKGRDPLLTQIVCETVTSVCDSTVTSASKCDSTWNDSSIDSTVAVSSTVTTSSTAQTCFEHKEAQTSLVDYDSDSEDEEHDQTENPPKKIRLS